jgi:hypothetical protein
MCHTSNNDMLKTIDFGYFQSKMKQRVTCSVIHLKIGRHLIYKRKLSELWLMQNTNSCRSLFKRLEILPPQLEYIQYNDSLQAGWSED